LYLRRRRAPLKLRWPAGNCDAASGRCPSESGRDDPAFVVPLALGIGYAEKWDRQQTMLAALDEQIAQAANAEAAKT
jgi:hypothetical protein